MAFLENLLKAHGMRGWCWVWKAALWLSLNLRPASGEVAPGLGEEAPLSPVPPLLLVACVPFPQGCSPPPHRPHLTQVLTPSSGNASLTASVFMGGRGEVVLGVVGDSSL